MAQTNAELALVEMMLQGFPFSQWWEHQSTNKKCRDLKLENFLSEMMPDKN